MTVNDDHSTSWQYWDKFKSKSLLELAKWPLGVVLGYRPLKKENMEKVSTGQSGTDDRTEKEKRPTC